MTRPDSKLKFGIKLPGTSTGSGLGSLVELSSDVDVGSELVGSGSEVTTGPSLEEVTGGVLDSGELELSSVGAGSELNAASGPMEVVLDSSVVSDDLDERSSLDVFFGGVLFPSPK
jgi:hypothetical protein